MLYVKKTPSSSTSDSITPLVRGAFHIDQFFGITHVYEEIQRENEAQLDMADRGSNMGDVEEALVTQISGASYPNDHPPPHPPKNINIFTQNTQDEEEEAAVITTYDISN